MVVRGQEVYRVMVAASFHFGWSTATFLAPLDGSLRSRRLLALGSSANVMGMYNFSASKLGNTGWICLPKRTLLKLALC